MGRKHWYIFTISRFKANVASEIYETKWEALRDMVETLKDDQDAYYGRLREYKSKGDAILRQNSEIICEVNGFMNGYRD